MVTELCPGGCLLDQIVDVEAFSEADAQQISRQVCAAVVHLHQMGIAHRDIKPDNVLCTDHDPHKGGHIKLCDFGFAAEFNADEAENSSFYQLIGTPEYLAPEMVEALLKVRKGETSKGYNFKVDYWALGCLVYELIAGEPPFLSEDDEEQYQLTLEAPLEFPADHFQEVSEAAQSLLRGLLERDPESRIGLDLPEHEWIATPDEDPRFPLSPLGPQSPQSPQSPDGRGMLESFAGSPFTKSGKAVNVAALVNRKMAAQKTFRLRRSKRMRRAHNAVLATRRFASSR